MKIPGFGEILADDPLPDDPAISFYQLSVGFAREQQLGEAGHQQRVDESKNHRRNQREPYRGNKVSFHDFFSSHPEILQQHVNNFDSDERRNNSPEAIDEQIPP